MPKLKATATFRVHSADLTTSRQERTIDGEAVTVERSVLRVELVDDSEQNGSLTLNLPAAGLADAEDNPFVEGESVTLTFTRAGG